MKPRWTRRALRDLTDIGDFIAADDPRAARAWLDRLRRRAATAAKSPGAGRMVPELGRKDLREVLLGSYRIVYRVQRQGIVVLTVFEGHRLFGGVNPESE